MLDLQPGLAWPAAVDGVGARRSPRIGIDTVRVSAITESLAQFGPRFLRRLFTQAEVDSASLAPAQRDERLAARFAAKEAVIKALDLAEFGADWREIEVVSRPGAPPRLALHGRVAGHAQRLGALEFSLSLSHDGDQACAAVITLVPH
jgi:holo-[acyl-carrier protein] synthase